MSSFPLRLVRNYRPGNLDERYTVMELVHSSHYMTLSGIVPILNFPICLGDNAHRIVSDWSHQESLKTGYARQRVC